MIPEPDARGRGPLRTIYPRAAGLWTVRDENGWGVLDPERDVLRSVEPDADPALPALAAASVGGDLVGYRAGRRAIVATSTSFIKVVRPGRVEAIVERHRMLGSGTAPVAVPAVLGATKDGQIEMSIMSGPSLHEQIRSDPTCALRDVGAFVAALHRRAIPSGLEARRPDAPTSWAATTRRYPTPHQAAIERIAARLPNLDTRAEVVVHGDLHDKNIFGRGSRLALIDLDGLALGAPEDDVANLGVHLELRNLQARSGLPPGSRAAALYRSYRSVRPLDDDRLRLVEQHTWFRLACLYQYRTRSEHLVPLLLAASGVEEG